MMPMATYLLARLAVCFLESITILYHLMIKYSYDRKVEVFFEKFAAVCEAVSNSVCNILFCDACDVAKRSVVCGRPRARDIWLRMDERL